MAHFPEHLDATEAKIINALLTRVLAEGLHVKVYDGEEFSTELTRDRALIQRETAATEETTYVLYHGKDRLGSVWLIHGNGEDVLSDYSWNTKVEDAEAIMDRLCKTE